MLPEGETPDRRVEIHVVVDADKPGLLELALFLRGKGLLLPAEGVFPTEPITFLPDGEPHERGARGKICGIGGNKGSVVQVQSAGRPELPQADRGGTWSRGVVVRAEEKLDGVIRMGDRGPSRNVRGGRGSDSRAPGRRKGGEDEVEVDDGIRRKGGAEEEGCMDVAKAKP